MPKKFNNFIKIWSASLISAVGSGFTSYGLSIWIYLQTGKVSRYSMIAVVIVLPGILIGLFAGVLADLVNRKKTMITCDVINANLTFLLLVLLKLNQLKLWHIYFVLSIISVLSAIRWSVYVSSIVLIVEEKDLKKANGLDQFINAVSQIFPPIFAALMVNRDLGVESIILVDTISYVISIMMVWQAEINYISPKLHDKNILKIFKEEFVIGVYFLCKCKELIGLLVYMAILNYISGGVSVLFSPMILSFASEYALSIIMAFASFGMIFGSLIVTIIKKIELNTRTILIYGVTLPSVVIVAGLFESVFIICVSSFVFFSAMAIVGSAFQYIFQKNVPTQLQGRVFAIRKTIVTSTLPISYLSLGLLADHVFIPFVNNTSKVFSIFGNGNSRGIGLLLIVLGVVSIVFLLITYYKLDIKRLDMIDLKGKQR